MNYLGYKSTIFSINPPPRAIRKNTDLSPGSATNKENGIKLIAECINRAHSETKTVQVVLENSAGGTNSIGSSFEDLKGIIDQVEGIISPLEMRLMRSI